MRITQVRRSWVVFSEDQFFWSVAFHEDEISHILRKYYLVLARLNVTQYICRETANDLVREDGGYLAPLLPLRPLQPRPPQHLDRAHQVPLAELAHQDHPAEVGHQVPTAGVVQ